MKTIKFKPLKPKVVLAVGAHPDDIDFGASGSIAKWTKTGTKVHYAVITDGSKGSSVPKTDPIELAGRRQKEQRAAAKLLGATDVHFLDYEDGYLEVTMELKTRLTALIRQIRPDTVVVMDPASLYVAELGFVNHPDHRAAGQATLDAVFPLARDGLSFPELLTQGLKPHKVKHLLLINLEKQNYIEDISETFDLKIKALLKHASQISSKSELMAWVGPIAADYGKQIGTKYGEGFVRLDLPG